MSKCFLSVAAPLINYYKVLTWYGMNYQRKYRVTTHQPSRHVQCPCAPISYKWHPWFGDWTIDLMNLTVDRETPPHMEEKGKIWEVDPIGSFFG